MRILAATAGVVLALAWGTAAEVGDEAAFRKVRPDLMRGLQDTRPGAHLAVAAELPKWPVPGAVQLAEYVLRTDKDPAVRKAALDALAGFRGEPALVQAMVEPLRQQITEHNRVLINLILTSDVAPAQDALLAHFDKVLPRNEAAHRQLIAAMDELPPDQDGLRALNRLITLKIFTKDFAFCRCAVENYLRIPKPEAVDVLMGLAATLDGEIQWQIAAYLTKLTGQKYGTDGKAWKGWWTANKEKFAFPKPEQLSQAAPPIKVAAPVEYYGIPVQAKRIVFLIDHSGSMAGDRIENARLELVRVLGKLPDNVQFTIVAFDNELTPWSPRMVKATRDHTAVAAAWVSALQARGGTHTYDALDTALKLDPESIFLLTDGVPAGGKITRPDAILDAVRKTNQFKRASIHVIGLGTGGKGNVFHQFLERLADQNRGFFRAVD